MLPRGRFIVSKEKRILGGKHTYLTRKSTTAPASTQQEPRRSVGKTNASRGTYEPGHLEVGHGGAREQGSGPRGGDGGELGARLLCRRWRLHLHLCGGRRGAGRGLRRGGLLGQLQLLLLHFDQVFLKPRRSSFSATSAAPRAQPD